MKRALNVLFFSLRGKEEVEVLRGKTDEGGKKGKRDSSPRIHCGWLWEDGRRGLQRKRQREVTNKKRRREEGEQQFDSRCVLSLVIYFTEVFVF